ncbi:MAG: type IV pilin protein [Polyangiales bacterium]
MKRPRGFTLVELMIVVAIIGVLASLALYGVSRYLKHSKAAEATANLGSIENGARQQYQRETAWGSVTPEAQLFVHTFCPSTALTPPAVPKSAKAMTPASAWLTDGWTCLKFNVGEPQYYAYQHISNSSTGTAAVYTASAYGDLDGNGVQSTFELSGHGGPLGDAVRDVFRVINEDE